MRELRAAIDVSERRQVARALTAGRSMASVARALGVTRQSAHRRFRELIAPATRNHRPAPTPELRLIVEYARGEAHDLGAPAVASEHLLVGILRLGDHPACAALQRLGVSYGAARDVAARTVCAAGETDVKRVLCAALQLAQRDGCRQIGIAHVLAAALRDPDSGATATLRALRASPDVVIGALAGEVDAAAP